MNVANKNMFMHAKFRIVSCYMFVVTWTIREFSSTSLLKPFTSGEGYIQTVPNIKQKFSNGRYNMLHVTGLVAYRTLYCYA